MASYRLIVISVCFLSVATQRITAEESSLSIKHYQHLKKSSVEILVNRRLAGSGCLVDATGLVMTAAHVLGKSPEKVEVLVGDSPAIKATIIAKDLGHDLALLQLPKPEKPYPFLELATELPAVSQQVYLYGAPFYRHRVLFPGTIARSELTFEYLDQHYVEVIHIAASSPQGVSGGPWITKEGKLCGIQSGMLTLNNAPQGLAFVAPLSALKSLLQTKQSPSVSSLGIAVEELCEQNEATLKTIPEEVNGVYVRVVKDKGPFAKSGMKKGCVVLAFDETTTHTRDQFVQALRNKKPGETVKLTLLTTEQKQEIVEMKLVELETLK